MIYEITGKVEDVCAPMTFNSGFTKRDIIINAADAKSKYPNIIKFSAVKDACQQLDGYRKGDEVKIRFVIDGRIWDGPKGRSYFTDLKVLGIEAVGGKSSASTKMPSPATPPSEGFGDGDADGMPF